MSHLRSLNRSLIALSITMLAVAPLSTTTAQDSAQDDFQRATLQAEGQPMLDPVAETSDDTAAALGSHERATLQAEGQVMVEGRTESAVSEP